MTRATEIISEGFAKKCQTTAHNCQVYSDGGVWRLRLHGTCIAWWANNNTVCLTAGGYPTRLTIDRLNGVCMAIFGTKPFGMKQGQLHYSSGLGGKALPIDPDQIVRIEVFNIDDPEIVA